MLNLESCDASLHTITITPTIPVRPTRRGYPKITFHAPKEVDVVKSCEVELQGTDPVEIKVKAACNQGTTTSGLKAIVPSIFYLNSVFWHVTVGLPTIWVCLYAFMLFKCVL